MIHPYKFIEGKAPTQKEYAEWTASKWVYFLRFTEFYISGEGKFEKYEVSMEKIRSMEDSLKDENHPFNEFIWRVGKWADKTNYVDYYNKFSNHARAGLTYLKKHPGSITVEMKEIMEKHPNRMKWALEQYGVVDSAGGPIVQRDETVTVATGGKMELPSLQARMMTALVKTVDVYEQVAASITTHDIRGMEAKDKISALAKLSFVFQMAQKKIVPNSFTTININGSSKSMEEAMLAFTKKKSE